MSTTSRRGFLLAFPVVAAGVARAARAQGNAAPQDSSSFVAPGATMEGDGYVPVSLPPKPGAKAVLTPEERTRVEQQIACPCPCTMDIHTCRRSMPCGFSPRMTADVGRLVEGGYTGEEILAAFERAYGERVLMSPKREGFNLVGYLLPAVLVSTGAVGLAVLIRHWGKQRVAAPVTGGSYAGVVQDATPDELARLEAAVRGDGRDDGASTR